MNLLAETVHTVTDYYDGPCGGIVNYGGKPHVYERVEEADDDYHEFLLEPISEETFRLALEDWAIWCRWRLAFDRGEATLDTHPALAEDRSRHDELNAMLGTRLKLVPERALRARGRMEVRKSAKPEISESEFVVHWRVGG